MAYSQEHYLPIVSNPGNDDSIHLFYFLMAYIVTSAEKIREEHQGHVDCPHHMRCEEPALSLLPTTP